MSDVQREDAWPALWDRLHKAAASLDDLRRIETDFTEKNRIDAKASGVRLAISYMEDMGGQFGRQFQDGES